MGLLSRHVPDGVLTQDLGVGSPACSLWGFETRVVDLVFRSMFSMGTRINDPGKGSKGKNLALGVSRWAYTKPVFFPIPLWI